MKPVEGKIILDLCGGTGSWSKPYRDAGYNVQVITLPEYDVTAFCEAQIEKSNGDWVKGIGFGKKGDDGTCAEDCKLMIPFDEIYGILAAPPCTMFSMARTVAKTPRDLEGAMQIVQACLRIIWMCRYNGKRLAFWAMENPKARLRWFMGKPAMTFNPYDFGDPHRKPTDLWGNFNTDLKHNQVELNEAQRKQSQLNSRELPKLPDDYLLPTDFSKRAAQRSITPQGFAQAFFDANK